MKKYTLPSLPHLFHPHKRERLFYHVGRRLLVLMVLEVCMLIAAYLLILFFYMQNCKLQQNTTIYNLNHVLLLHTNSILEKLDVSSSFPLAHISDRYNDPLLRYLIKKDHDHITQPDFYRTFIYRANEVFIQFPEVESLVLLDKNGDLLDCKSVYNITLPKENHSSDSWYLRCQELGGKIYILTEEETLHLGLRSTSQNLHAARVLYDHLTLEPFCITLTGIRAANIPITFKTDKMFPEQLYAIYDSSGRKFIGNLDIPLTQDILFASRQGDYSFTRVEEGTKYVYHISYTMESGGSYSVIRTPTSLLTYEQFHTVFGILLGGLILILLNIYIFMGIINSINRPLAKLVNMCEEIGRGNFSVRVPSSQTDELSYLTHSLNNMSERVQQLIDEVYVRTLAERDLELQMLRSQINPHFLYNTLENMRMSAYTRGYMELSEMCLLLSKVLRYGVTNQSALVSIREELEHLQYYTSLLHYCFPGLQTDIFIDKALYEYCIIKVIFQPLVENAANHATKDPQNTVHIQVWGYEEKDDLVFIVSDNGHGMEKQYLEDLRASLDEESNTRYGIGLKNIHRRIKLYYGINYGLVINSSPGKGTSVTVRIPKTSAAFPSHTMEEKQGR